MSVRRAALLVALALLLVGCGSADESAAAETTAVKVYFLRDGKVWPVARDVRASETLGEVLTQLVSGPRNPERADLAFETAIPSNVVMTEIRADSDGTVEIPLAPALSTEAQAQLVYTLTQFDDVERVRIEDQTYTRADFEEQTPSVLVESPLPFEEVESPLRASGTANTFEATFEYELTDTDGRIVDQNFVTATSGTGTRGTFEFTTDEYEIPFDGIGSLIVFERSAEDGSKIHLVEIPLRMSK